MADDWTGHRLDCRDAAGIGKVTGLAGEGEEPVWLVVRTGRLGRVTAVPAADAVEGAGCVWVPYERELIKTGPKLESRGAVGDDAARALREHYGLG
jgi:hypothetical protein